MTTQSAGELVLLGGPPGAGKSTIAEILATTAPRATVHLHTDSFYVWIRAGFVPPYLPAAGKQNEVVTAVLVAAACEYARGGYDVIADGVLGPWMLEPFQTACKKQDITLSYAVLRPSLDVTLARATAREGRQLTEVEPIVGLYGAFRDLGRLEGHVLDSDGQSAEQTAASLSAGLTDRRYVLPIAPAEGG